MIKNYLLIAIRSLAKNKLHTTINVVGLSVAMACCILIVLFVEFELGYDRQNRRADRIYRMALGLEANTWAISAFPIGFLLQDNFPEIETFTRIKPAEVFVRNTERDIKQKEKVFYADSSVFDVLDIKLISGNAARALSEINSMVITPERARIYFGDEDPMGKTLTLMNDKTVYTITGIFQPLPSNSHVHMGIMVSSDNLEPMRPNSPNGWNYYTAHYTYLVLPANTDHMAFAKKISEFMDKNENLQPGMRKNDLRLQPLTSIHLYSNLGLEIEANGNMNTVYTMAAIGFFILIIACINFMNLTTAQSLKRAREVGIRKAVGSRRSQLIFQFLSESIVVSLSALVLAIVILYFAIPEFNSLSNKELVLNPVQNASVLGWLALVTLFVGVLAGVYPAFVISSFQPSEVLKGKFTANVKGQRLRQGLVIFQFAIAFIIIVGTFVIDSQLEFMLNKDMGFNREQVLVIHMPKDSVGDETVKTEMTRIPGVVSATRFIEMPGRMVRTTMFWHEGVEPGKAANLYAFSGDADLLKTLEMKMKTGEYFQPDPKQYFQEFILNETAVKHFGWTPEEAIGKPFAFGGERGENPGRIVGVVEDFHFKHLHDKIDPLVLYMSPNYEGAFLALKIETQNLNQVVEAAHDTWSRLIPDQEFEYEFLDESFDKLFNEEKRLGQLFGVFSTLAIIISCLGLFGLASFTLEQTRKSVAIRKVMGASVASILVLMSRGFLKLVLVGMVIASPIAWYVMTQWLGSFAYRVGMGWVVFAYAAAMAIVVAVLTISYHSFRAATNNPVNSLKE